MKPGERIISLEDRKRLEAEAAARARQERKASKSGELHRVFERHRSGEQHRAYRPPIPKASRPTPPKRSAPSRRLAELAPEPRQRSDWGPETVRVQLTPGQSLMLGTITLAAILFIVSWCVVAWAAAKSAHELRELQERLDRYEQEHAPVGP